MSYSPKVLYKIFSINNKRGEFIGGKNIYCFTKVRDICDNKEDLETLNKIKYLAFVDKSLNKNKVIFYLDFLHKILGKDVFSYKIRKNFEKCKKFFKDGTDTEDRYVIFTVNRTKNDINQRRKMLLILSAVRYIQEFPEIINAWYDDYKDNPNLELSELFSKFLEHHFKWYKNRENVSVKYDGLSIHGLVYYYNWYNSTTFTPIDLKTFQNNYVNKDYSEVQGYFTKS